MCPAYEPGTEVSRTLDPDTNAGRNYLCRNSHFRRRSSSSTLKISNPIATGRNPQRLQTTIYWSIGNTIARVLRIVDNPNSAPRTDVIKPRQFDTLRQARAAPIGSAPDFIADHHCLVDVRQQFNDCAFGYRWVVNYTNSSSSRNEKDNHRQQQGRTPDK
jgi:hypothetical protein